MTGIRTPITAQNAIAVFQINSLGGAQAKTGGGCLNGAASVKSAGSNDSVIRFYDGTSADGTLIATIGFGIQGPQPLPNYSFSTGLYVVASGTTAGIAEFAFS
jgi:hypothetical protein